MKLVQIPKKSGGKRIICIPSKKQKEKLRSILNKSLNDKQFKYCDPNIVMGFVPTRSVFQNARKHIGYQYTLNMDLSHFFDTVTPDMVREYLSEEEIQECFIDGHAYQGLPTSPAICNLAAVKMDAAIEGFLYKYFFDFFSAVPTADPKAHYVYTRYADDLTISYGKESSVMKDFYPILRDGIYPIIEQHGFIPNRKKTRLQTARYGNREVTGVYCSDKSISVNAYYRKRLRAAIHKGTYSVNGLREFARCMQPCLFTPQEQFDNLYKAAVHYYNKERFTKEGVVSKNTEYFYKRMIAAKERLEREPDLKYAKSYIKHIIKVELHEAQHLKKEDFVKLSFINHPKKS